VALDPNDLGTDIRCPPSIGRVFKLVSGKANLALALVRRYSTKRGGLFYDLNYGYSLMALLSSEFPAGGVLSVGPEIEAEAKKDERVFAASAKLDFDEVARKLTVTLTITTATGPFTLVIAATAVSVELLTIDGEAVAA